jgi:hypothetical protein
MKLNHANITLLRLHVSSLTVPATEFTAVYYIAYCAEPRELLMFTFPFNPLKKLFINIIQKLISYLTRKAFLLQRKDQLVTAVEK